MIPNAIGLQTGNYLSSEEEKYKGKPFRINGGDILHIHKGQKKHKYNYVPLTVDILKKAGLVKWKTVNSRYAAINNLPELLHGYVIYELQDDKMLIATNVVDFKYILLEYESNHGMGDLYHYIDIQYVHQMQNGYQFLTGEELQISL